MKLTKPLMFSCVAVCTALASLPTRSFGQDADFPNTQPAAAASEPRADALPPSAAASELRADALLPGAVASELRADPSKGSYSQLMNQASRISREIRGLEQQSKQRIAAEAKLAGIIEKAFDLRQELQREKIAAARKQLDLVQKRIQEREDFRAEIIRRKVADLIAGQDLQWPSGAASTKVAKTVNDRIRVGDVIACVIDGILPASTPGQPRPSPPVTRLDSGHIVTGFPVMVTSDGTLRLPMIDPVQIEGLTIRQAEEKIAKAYVDKQILREELAAPMLTLVPRSNEVNSILSFPSSTR